MKTSIWNKLVLWLSLGLLLFLNAYTFSHTASGWIFGIFLFLLFLFARRRFFLIEERFVTRLAWGCWIFLIALQIAYVFLIRNNVRYDAFWILDQAVEMLDTRQISPTLANNYFSQVPNNYGLTILTYWFLSILKLFGVPSGWFMRAVQLFNIAFIDLSLLFIYLFVRKIRGKAPALFFLFFCTLSPYPYVWAPYYYTSTASMMFACGAVWIWLCICHAASRQKRFLLAALLGFVCILGFQVRATSFIAFIAIALYWSLHRERGSLKNHLGPIAAFLLTALLTLAAWKGVIRHYVPFDTRDTALPVTHFMMMGTHGDGSFYMDDLRYTVSLPTAEEKLSGTLSVIRERLLENGFSGNVRLLLAKQLNCWADGTDSFVTENALCTDYNRLHTYVVGSKSGFLTAYSQAFRALQLLLTCIYCLLSFRKKQGDGMFLIALNLLGGMVFHLLWEAGAVYSIAFTFFSYAAAGEGLGLLEEWDFWKRRSPLPILAVSSLCFLASALFLLARKDYYTSQEQLASDFVANQHMETSGENGPPMKTGQIWTQTFETDKPFNVLDLYYGCPDTKNNASVYRLTLTDESGRVFYDGSIYGKEPLQDLAYSVQFEPVIPSGRTGYAITIEPLVQTEQDFLHFCSLDTSRVDMYPYGGLFIDGAPQGRDLCFRIRDLHIAMRASKKEYCLFALLLLSMELVFVFEAFRLVHQKRRPIA